uniref:Uncharacterized protein n=1 Tax=Magallana gigas TaxID=29159 RepID=K1Q089_MAGGI
MDDIDKEITFLREKIAEMRERSDMKTSIPMHERRALIRGFARNTMRKDEEYLCDHRSANETYANPRSNEMFPDYFELSNAQNRKTSPLPEEYYTLSLNRADAFWKSRERFTSPEISSTIESVPNSTDRKMIEDLILCKKIIANSSSVTVDRTLKSAKGKEKYPEWRLARRYKNGCRR